MRFISLAFFSLVLVATRKAVTGAGLKKQLHMKSRKEYDNKYYHIHKEELLKKNKEYREKNREKIKIQKKKYKKENPLKIKTYKLHDRLKSNFGISLKDYNDLLLKQGNLCAICFQPEKNKRLAVDHNHKTGKVRGLLCQKCNRGLGLFNDDSILVENAYKYLNIFSL